MLQVDAQIEQMNQEISAMEGKYLTFSLGSEEYGLEILKVREIMGIMEITSVPRTPDHVTKIEAGKIEITIDDCSIREMLDDIQATMSPHISQKNVEFAVSIGDRLPEKIRTDPLRLRQCLANLVGNAAKFTENGHIHVKVDYTPDLPTPHIRFSVEDTGIGIPPERQDAIFESFTQADGSTTKKYGGTGLGLAITTQLAGLLGGEISLKSEVGIGSVFTLTIPVEIEPQAQVTPETAQPAPVTAD